MIQCDLLLLYSDIIKWSLRLKSRRKDIVLQKQFVGSFIYFCHFDNCLGWSECTLKWTFHLQSRLLWTKTWNDKLWDDCDGAAICSPWQQGSPPVERWTRWCKDCSLGWTPGGGKLCCNWCNAKGGKSKKMAKQWKVTWKPNPRLFRPSWGLLKAETCEQLILKSNCRAFEHLNFTPHFTFYLTW